MQARRLGDFDVSVVGIGCNQFGPTADEETVRAIVDRALDVGINFFDVADEYGPDGVAETLLGRALRGRRDEVIVATKFGCVMHGDATTGGAGARWIEVAVEDSLRRLDTDRIDLYQQHFPDPNVLADETLEALDRLVRAGKIRHHGVCNLSASEIELRHDIAGRNGLAAPVAVQDRYNLLRREARDDLLPTVREHRMAFLPYFPLASGMLTGKYQSGEPLPSDSRFARHLQLDQAVHIIERDGQAVARLTDWAGAHGRGTADLAIAWLASQPEVTSVIAGVTKPSQVTANAKAAEWRLSSDDIAEVAQLA